MLRRKKFYVLYPEYFDKSVSRKNGRRVPLSKATEGMSLKKLVFALKKLNLDFQIQKDKAFPATWWEKSGRVLIPINKKDKVPKTQIIKDISEITRRIIVKPKTPEKGYKVHEKTKKPTTSHTKIRKKAEQQLKKKKQSEEKHEKQK